MVQPGQWFLHLYCVTTCISWIWTADCWFSSPILFPASFSHFSWFFSSFWIQPFRTFLVLLSIYGQRFSLFSAWPSSYSHHCGLTVCLSRGVTVRFYYFLFLMSWPVLWPWAVTLLVPFIGSARVRLPVDGYRHKHSLIYFTGTRQVRAFIVFSWNLPALLRTCFRFHDGTVLADPLPLNI